MQAPGRSLLIAALGLFALSGNAIAASRGDAENAKPSAVDAVFLTTFAPQAGPIGTKYGMRLTCGPREGACIATAHASITLTDGNGTIITSAEVDYEGTEAGTTWRDVETAQGAPAAGTYCTTADVSFTTPDGYSGTVSSSEPACTTFE